MLAELEVMDEGHSLSESLWGEVERATDIEVISASTEAPETTGMSESH